MIRSRGVRIVLAVIAAAALAGTAFVLRYPGFSRAGLDYTLYTSIHERMNISSLLLYWLRFLGRMQLDDSGFYTFDASAAKSGFDAGLLEYHRGNFEGAIRQLERDIERNGDSEERLFWLAMSQLRRGEQENCLPQVLHAGHTATEHAQYCALPVRKFHTMKEYARAGAQSVRKLLDRYDKDNALYKWLLNYACLITDDFPAGVPAEYRAKPEFIDRYYGETGKKTEREFEWLRFEEMAAEFGINTHNAGRGIGIEDFDGDGYLDILTGGNFDDLRYYHNEGGKTYSDWTDRGGLEGFRQPFFISVGDYDNDGRADFVVTHMYYDRFTLFHNKGDGTFVDVTADSGLLDLRPQDGLSSAWAPAWADVDNDGDLDLFVCQMGIDIPFAQGLLSRPKMNSALYLNEAGRFVDRTIEYGLRGVVRDRYFVGAAFGDYDGDGFTDLFLSSPIINTSALLRNVGGTRFERSTGLSRRDGGFVAAFLDANQDGRLDIFHGGFSDARTSIEMGMFGADPDLYRSGKSAILLQQADGSFVEQKGFFGMPGGTMGASFGDVNNDGCFDYYLGTGSPEGWFIYPNLMFLGVPDGRGGCSMRTADVSMTNSLASIQKGHGISFFDFNDDGLEDIYSSLGGMWPADRWPNQFFVNRSAVSNSWIKIRLRGRKSNYFGLGASIHLIANDGAGGTIHRYAHMDQKTGFGSGPYVVQMGLGGATSVERVEVYWPVSRCRQSYTAQINQLNVLDESSCGSADAPAPPTPK